MDLKSRIRLVPLLGLLLASGSVLLGCSNYEEAERQRHLRQISTRSTQLSLEEVVETFNHLYDFVDLELEPPVAILNNRRTYDGQDAMATFGRNPAAGDVPYSNYLTITSRNIALKQLEGDRAVRPGDQIHYYILDEDSDEFLAEIGMPDLEAVPMTVAQVIDNQHILIEERYPPVETEGAYKIEIWRNIDDRVREIETRLGAYGEYGDPPLDWQPTPDEMAIEQALNRLNQWMRHSHESKPIEPPALLATLPAKLRQSPRLADYLSPEALGRVSFDDEEGRRLQEAVWLRNIAGWARGDAVGDIELATALFDWTVRHIQLEKADSSEEAHYLARNPWEILLYGVGTAEQRAWIFALLCRQQGLPAVVLGIPEREAQEAESSSRPKFWSVAVVGEDGLYLFDPALGVPIPGPDGTGVATLAEAAADPAVLERLSLDEHPYPWTQEDVRNATALVVASPLSLSRRTALLQEQLVGRSGFVIHSDPEQSASAVREQGQVENVALWSWPFEVLDRKLAMATRQGAAANEHRMQRIRAALTFRVIALSPHLWKARALHFRGPAPQRSSTTAASDRLEQTEGHQEAIGLYQAARIPDRELATEPSEKRRQSMSRAKENATYWLALLKMDQGDYDIAMTSWLPQVVDAEPPSPWLAGARYNLARANEAVGQLDKAIALYEKDDSAQLHGNRLRARWLEERLLAGSLSGNDESE